MSYFHRCGLGLPVLLIVFSSMTCSLAPCRFHQHLIVDKAVKVILGDGFLLEENPRLLLACVCRSGKTYMVAGIWRELIRRRPDFRDWKVAVITPRPSETRKEWEKIFKNHADFEGLSVRVFSVQELRSKNGGGGLSELAKSKRVSSIGYARPRLPPPHRPPAARRPRPRPPRLCATAAARRAWH